MNRKKEKQPIFGVIVGLTMVITAAYFILNSCEKQVIEESVFETDKEAVINADQRFPFVDNCGQMVQKGLFIADKERVGTAYFFNDGLYFYAHLLIRKGYKLHNVFMYSGNWDELPMNTNGTADVNQFTVVDRNIEAPLYRRLKVPLSQLPPNYCVSLMAQVEVNSGIPPRPFLQLVSAWVEGKPYGVGNNAHFFYYQRQVCMEQQETGPNE